MRFEDKRIKEIKDILDKPFWEKMAKYKKELEQSERTKNSPPTKAKTTL